MVINSKMKGKRAELEIVHILKDNGFEEARRTAQYCGNTKEASDVVGLEGFHIEVKHQEVVKIYDWIAQAERDCRDGEIPVVFHRKNNKKWLCTLDLNNFLDIIKK